LNYDHIHGTLYQGSAPTPGLDVALRGFTVLVLCAEEFQPPAFWYPRVQVIHAPNDDRFELPTREELAGAIAAARQVSVALKAGQKVLVTCRMGINRSGLVSALALHMTYGMSGREAIRLVKQKRKPRALTNPGFVEVLSRLPNRAMQ